MDLTSPQPEVPPEPALTPPENKSPGLAFALSLVVPGTGQFYCGKAVRGGWTLFFSVVSVLAAGFLLASGTPEGETFGGMFFRIALFLYVFAFLDAFYTAREINDGADAHIVENPRVAAILNLLTRGFGYFYIGERGKGLAIFFILGAASRAATSADDPTLAVWAEIVLEIALAIMAMDAYRLANASNQGRIDGQPPLENPLRPEGGLSPALPLALGGLFVLGYTGLLTLAVVMEDGPDFSVIDREAESLTEQGDKNIYFNPTYGVEMQIPAEWEFDRSDTDYFVEAQTLDFGCAVGFMPDTAGFFGTLESTAENLKDTILAENANFQFLEQKDISLSGSPAVEVSFTADVEGTTVLQDYLLTLRGSTVYAVILTKAEVFQETCADDFESIRAGIVIPE